VGGICAFEQLGESVPPVDRAFRIDVENGNGLLSEDLSGRLVDLVVVVALRRSPARTTRSFEGGDGKMKWPFTEGRHLRTLQRYAALWNISISIPIENVIVQLRK
jgi:hypothetical protein